MLKSMSGAALLGLISQIFNIENTMSYNFRSKPVPVKATQWFKDGDHPNVYPQFDGFNIQGYELDTSLGSTAVDFGDWIVEFPDGEIHVVRDEHFKIRFQEVKVLSKEDKSYAKLLASIGDCE
jgi:hypothetical protein